MTVKPKPDHRCFGGKKTDEKSGKNILGPFSIQPIILLDVLGRPNTRDYGQALEALKLLTENVIAGATGLTCLSPCLSRAH